MIEGVNNSMNRDKQGRVISQPFYDALFTLGLGDYGSLVDVAQDAGTGQRLSMRAREA